MLKNHQEMTVYRCGKSIIEFLVLSSCKAAAGKITVIKVCSPIIRKKKQTKKREFTLFFKYTHIFHNKRANQGYSNSTKYGRLKQLNIIMTKTDYASTETYKMHLNQR